MTAESTSASPYEHRAIEAQAQARWQHIDAYRAIENDARYPNGKFYACSMLPYPSGKLHMGHVRNYTINDMLARWLRMNGYNVLMPMGWDAFGLPAENAAIKNGVPPAKWTYENIAQMKRQMQAMGLGIDWSREVAACDPNYYKWNQWLFLKMLERGIAYRKTQVVNWDPVDQTVLANEQVIDGRGWRTGALVEKREIPGYYLRITAYAGELLDAVRTKLDGWPERVRLMQENWIGESIGVRFAFTHRITGPDGAPVNDGKMYVFTTRADTIMGVTFCAIAAEHPIATVAAARAPKLAAFIEECRRGSVMEADLAQREKLGMPTGFTVTHPLTGEAVPVWVANYVLMSYGDGAVMGVPGHDERDLEFANKYRLPVKQVISVDNQAYDPARWQDWYADKTHGQCIHSGRYDGLTYQRAVDAVAADLAKLNLGEKQITYRLRDWGISRQRYWGTPIPIVLCEACGPVPVPYDQLPVVLPEDCIPDGSGNPLNKHAGFLNVDCPKCGKAAKRETDTMDTFVDSSWYFMRYCSPDSAGAMVDRRNDYWMPMDQYIGGIEHAVLHLLYARFWTRVMRDLGLLKFDEPFTRLLCQGMVLNHIYQRRTDKGGIEYFWPADVENIHGADGRISGAKLKSDGTAIDYAGVGTMSKSRNNGVDPQQIIDQYGADTARLYMMFTSPPEQTLEWSDAGVEGAYRFLRRVWTLAMRLHGAIAPPKQNAPARYSDEPSLKFRRELHSVLKQANFDYQRMQFNTVVSACMKMQNALEALAAVLDADPVRRAERAGAAREGLSILLRVLYPATPHVCDVLWQRLGFDAGGVDLLNAPWPQVDDTALEQQQIELVLQINGKLRGSLTVAADASKEAIEALARAHDAVGRYGEGRPIKKVIVIAGRLVNVVV